MGEPQEHPGEGVPDDSRDQAAAAAAREAAMADVARASGRLQRLYSIELGIYGCGCLLVVAVFVAVLVLLLVAT